MKDLIDQLELDFFIPLSIQRDISLFFEPKKEIKKEKYFTSYLNASDANHLQLFLGNFLYKLKTEVEILAVGSSTFPKSHWKKIEKINKKDPTVKIPETYKGIDLLILPEDKIEHKRFEESIVNSLNYWGLNLFNLREIVSEMEWYEKIDGRHISLITYDKESRGFSISLPNKTGLNIIFGKEGYFKTASEKIREERKKKHPFSLIYTSKNNMQN